MPLYQVIVLAVVQGLTEFLPVSSSAHLILVRRLLGWNELSAAQELTFDVALHAGTLLSVLLYFASTWTRLLGAALGVRVGGAAQEEVGRERRLFWLLVAATVPGAVAGKLLEHVAEDYFREHVPLIAAALILVALIMGLGEKFGSYTKSLTQAGWADALTIGAAQAFAIIPGVSRSGSTIAAGLFRGMDRDAATRFSFLLATPIIAGVSLLKAYQLFFHQHPDAAMKKALAVGLVVSAAVGYAAIAGFLRYLRTRTLTIFIVYRVIFGIIILALAYRGYFG